MNMNKLLIVGGVIWLLLAMERTAKAKQAAAAVPLKDPAGTPAAWYMTTSGMGAPINFGFGNANVS